MIQGFHRVQIDEFKQFLKKNRYPFFIAYIIVIAAFVLMLTNHTVSIDEETRLSNAPADGGILETEDFIVIFFAPPTKLWYSVNAT